MGYHATKWSFSMTTPSPPQTYYVNRSYFMCKHCGKYLDEHADRKCLWEATSYEALVVVRVVAAGAVGSHHRSVVIGPSR